MIYAGASLNTNVLENLIPKVSILNGNRPMGEALLAHEENMRKRKLIIIHLLVINEEAAVGDGQNDKNWENYYG